MQLSLKWVKNYVDLDINTKEGLDDLCKRLTMVGLEVSSIKNLADNFKDIVVAQIIEKKCHPNAEKLSICRVTTGEETYSIVCGATNQACGDKVVLAKIGSHVYFNEPEKKFQIKKTKIRDESSEGMLCSYEELCLPGDSRGIIILPPDTALGENVARHLGSDDVIIEIEITPNRGDCLSHIGIAREIATIYKRQFRYPEWIVNEDKEQKTINEYVRIENVDFEICPRYMARIIKGVKVGPSPFWLMQRLTSIGVRSINNIVDITNFVLYEFGQPLHAFDFDKIRTGTEELRREIIVRKAQVGEKFTTLDEIERNLTEEDILICDQMGPIAIGGVMGGKNSEITEETVNVLLESAVFGPEKIRKTAKRLDLQTDASTRFEKRVDRYQVHRAMDRAIELMREFAQGSIVRGFVDTRNFDPGYRTKIYLDLDLLHKFLGVKIESSFIESSLQGLGFEMLRVHQNGFNVLVPTWRNDIEIEEDLFEEVARHWGLDKIPQTLPSFNDNLYIADSPFLFLDSLKDIMVGLGFFEVINYSFFSSQFEKNNYFESSKTDEVLTQVDLANPLTEDFKTLRRSLLPGLIKTAKYNYNRGSKNLMLFELGMIFGTKNGSVSNFDSIIQKRKIAAIIMGGQEVLEKESYSVKIKPFDFFDVKGVVDILVRGTKVEFRKLKKESILHLGEGAELFIGDYYLGYMGKLNPILLEREELVSNVFVIELDLEGLERNIKAKKIKPLSKYPSVSRDLALMLDRNISAGQILDVISSITTNIILDAKIFDVFLGENLGNDKKSVAVHLTYQSNEKTLTDKEIDSIERRILNALEDKLHAGLRPI